MFGRTDVALDPGRIHRFVVGEDAAPTPMSAARAAEELGDPFATLVLLQGTFPGTAEGALAALKAAAPAGSPLAQQMSFVLGEGSQIAFDEASAQLDRGFRFVVTLGATPNGPPQGPDVLVSASAPDQADIELMAWDQRRGGFNYYRSMGTPPAWVFAGNSRHALSEPTQGKGAFESHKSGAFLMKELKFPWVHWDSSKAHIFATAFAPGDARATHEWFEQKPHGGAYEFERAVALPAISRWARARFDGLLPNGSGTIDDPARIMEQVITTPTANLVSSTRESRAIGPSAPPIDLPGTFFVDADGLSAVGLVRPPKFGVAIGVYQASVKEFDVRLDDEQGFTRPGDTHFAFVVPERAFEDQVVVREAMARGLLSRRLVAALLMTDFPNPIFSDGRAKLLEYVPATAVVENGTSTFSQELADAILAAADESPEGSPEREFAQRWSAGDGFEATFNDVLRAYYAAIAQRLRTQEGFDAYFRLAESRRRRGIEEMPIFREFKLLFAHTSTPTGARAEMRPDGSVRQT